MNRVRVFLVDFHSEENEGKLFRATNFSSSFLLCFIVPQTIESTHNYIHLKRILHSRAIQRSLHAKHFAVGKIQRSFSTLNFLSSLNLSFPTFYQSTRVENETKSFLNAAIGNFFLLFYRFNNFFINILESRWKLAKKIWEILLFFSYIHLMLVSKTQRTSFKSHTGWYCFPSSKHDVFTCCNALMCWKLVKHASLITLHHD